MEKHLAKVHKKEEPELESKHGESTHEELRASPDEIEEEPKEEVAEKPTTTKLCTPKPRVMPLFFINHPWAVEINQLLLALSQNYCLCLPSNN